MVKWFKGKLINHLPYIIIMVIKMIDSTMTKRKTSLNIDDKVWQEWIIYVVKKAGTSRKVSDYTVEALTEYMKNNPV